MRIIVLFLLAFAALAQRPVRFREHTIATGLKGGYQVVVADLNHDGKPDIIALASGMPDLVWYQNPTWERHVLVTNVPRSINCAAEDIDGDGIPEIILAWEFSNEAAKSVGKVALLKHDGDPKNPWKMTPIDELPTSHRLRWADLEGTGHRVVVNAPLTAATAKGPGFEGHTPLVYYRPGEWKRQVLSAANEGVQHGIFVTRWQAGDTRDSLLTASFSGIDLLRWVNGAWLRTEISKGDTAVCPKCGSSDVAIGHSGKERFIAAIEPWHGNQVAVYRETNAVWLRTIIDDTLADGHTILAADLNGDGNDEIVVGARQGTKAVSMYSEKRSKGEQLLNAGKDGRWEKQVVDESGLGPAACTVADLNGDGAVDLICIGSAGAAVKWYENVTSAN